MLVVCPENVRADVHLKVSRLLIGGRTDLAIGNLLAFLFSIVVGSDEIWCGTREGF